MQAMFKRFLRAMAQLSLEEKILNGALFVGIVSLFMPWIGGRLSLIEETVNTFSGLGFHTAFIGYAVLALSCFAFAMTAVPLSGGRTLISKEYRELVRLGLTGVSSILTLAALSVLLSVSLNSSGLEIRFGVYVALISYMIATLYSFLAVREERISKVKELFHYPEANLDEKLTPQKPVIQHHIPMPPPPAPEEHRHFASVE